MSKRLMGKLSSFGSIDIIPITSGAPKNTRLQHNLKKKFKKMKKNRLHLSDPKIIERVRQYLEENVDQTYVDVNLMAQILRKKYMEYSRRKEVPFRSMVESAYKAVMHSYGLDSDQSSDGDDNDELDDLDESDDDDLQVMGGNSSNNQLNSSIQAMYMQNQKNTYSKTPASMDNDCIDIVDSSDESDGAMMGYDKHKAGAPLYHQYPDTVTRQLTSRVPNLEIRSKRSELEEHNVPAGNTKSGKTQRKRKVPEGGMTDIEKIRFKKKKVDSTTAKPSVSFKHIGGIDNILKDLCDMLIHLKHPEVYKHLGTKPPRGFLLHGPPGCGKTLLANSIAGKLGVPMIGVVATELVAGVSGESEERIRELFDKAVSLAPCVLFIDEVDVISANRMNAQKDMERRIVAQLISSMDGLGQKENGDGVLVIGATNSVDSLDPSLRRVGRFDQEICLGIPDQKARASILKVVCSNLKLQPNFDFDNLAKLTPGYVGADLLALSSKAASNAVKRVFVELKEDEESEPTIFTVDDKETDIVPKPSEQMADVEIVENKQTIDPQTIDLDDTDVEEKMLDDSVELVKKPTENGTVKEGESVELDDTETATNNVDDKIDDTTKTINKEPEDSVVDISKADDTTKADDILKEVEASKPAELLKPVDEKVVGEEGTVVEKNDIMEIKETELTEEDKPANKLPKAVAEEIEEKMSLGSPLESGDVKKSSGLVKQWTLAEMEALIDNPEPPLSEKELKNLCITMQDFELALKTIQPSAKREGFITVPNVTWDEIGSLQDIRQELQMAILAPVRYPDRFASLGLTAPSGVLLCGPPGCGKTLLAKAIANEAGVNFISVKGPELLNMYVGESERAVRQCFTRARNSAPCVIFFDEFDSLCPKRSDSSQGGVSSRVVNQLLTEMDGVEGRFGVFLMAATNRPDIVDPAVMRPGRLDKILYVGLPNEDDRLEILKAITKNGTQPVLHSDVDLAAIASSAACTGYTGADLAGLVRQASMQALRESMDAPELPQGTLSVTHLHFLQALAVIRPSVSAEDRRHYEKLRKKYATVPTAKENGDGIYIEPMDDS